MPPLLANLMSHRLSSDGIPVSHHYLGAFLGKKQGNGFSYSRSSSCNKSTGVF
jgi:hypothetical protein